MADFTVEQLEQMEQSIDRERKGIIATADFVEPEELHRELIERIRKYHPNTDITMIEKAYHIAYTAHEGQCRKSGEPYIIHPLCVAIILADLEMDKETIVAGLLHDVVEDTVMTIEEISAEFSDEVALLVDGVTKLGQLSYSADKLEVQAENLRKMFLAMAKDTVLSLLSWLTACIICGRYSLCARRSRKKKQERRWTFMHQSRRDLVSPGLRRSWMICL